MGKFYYIISYTIVNYYLYLNVKLLTLSIVNIIPNTTRSPLPLVLSLHPKRRGGGPPYSRNPSRNHNLVDS
jgi:hypothetical protein